MRRVVAATNKIKATIERPDAGTEQPVQYKPVFVPAYDDDDQLEVANAITQKSADMAVITVVIISRIVSLICMISLLIFSPTDVNDGNK